MLELSASKSPWAWALSFVRTHGRGILVSVVVAVAAQFLSEDDAGGCRAGIEFTARTVLRFGVALLGARISIELMMNLGADLIAVVIVGVILTILFGLLGARLLGRGWRFGVLTGGSVAICGASAAMALSAILPKNEHSERNLIFTVLSVTVLSTIAMIAYPILTQAFDFDDDISGVFLGGTIHDVAQVVGAGFSVSDQAGEVATLVKLIRVAMLAPVVLVISFVVRRYAEFSDDNGKRPPILPMFVAGFLVFAALNSMGLIPDTVQSAMASLSRWALLVSNAAVGMKTSLKRILDVGGHAIGLIVTETIFIAVLVLVGVYFVHY